MADSIDDAKESISSGDVLCSGSNRLNRLAGAVVLNRPDMRIRHRCDVATLLLLLAIC